ARKRMNGSPVSRTQDTSYPGRTLQSSAPDRSCLCCQEARSWLALHCGAATCCQSWNERMPMTRSRFLPLLFITGSIAAANDDALVTDYVKASIGAVPETLGLDPFYKKYTDATGIAVVGSDKVPDAAILVARDIVNHMLAKRPDV